MSQTLDSIIPGVVKKGQCITQNLIDSKPFTKPQSFHEGMITGMVCNNAQTGESHYEKDCAFTLIGIPFTTDDMNTSGNFVFEFWWGLQRELELN